MTLTDPTAPAPRRAPTPSTPAPSSRTALRQARLPDVANSRVGRVLGVVQPAGWAVLGLTACCLLAGRLLGWAELTVIAAAGLVLCLLCSVFLVGRMKVDIALRVTPQRLTAGDPPVTGEVTVTSTGGRSLLPLELELPVGRRSHTFLLPSLPAGGLHSEAFLIPVDRRSVIPVGPTRTRRGDPLGLFRRTQDWSQQIEVFVRPVALPLDSLGAGLLRDLEGVSTNDTSPSDLAFHALREYVPGDDLRHVHWLASAKTDSLMVRQYLDTRRSHVTLVVDHRLSSYASQADFETALSVAATIARRSVLDEFELSFVCSDQEATDSPTRVLDAMCRVELGNRELVQATLRAARIAPDTSLLFVISGAYVEYTEVQRACLAFGPEVRRFAITIDPSSSARVTESGTLPVLSVPALASLPSVLHWSVK